MGRNLLLGGVAQADLFAENKMEWGQLHFKILSEGFQ